MGFRILAFDTSTSMVHLCLSLNGQPVWTQSAESSAGARQGVVALLVPTLDQALKQAGWQKQQVDCLVVGQGPGSFTGIRAGVVTARTLAQVLNLPLIGVSTLEVLARQATVPAAVVLAGAPGHFFVAAYGQSLEKPLVAPSYISTSGVKACLGQIERWLIDKDAAQALAVADKVLEPLPLIKNLAVSEAQIAWNRLSLRMPGKGLEVDDKLCEKFHWRLVEPLYLRGPSVTLKKAHGN